MSEITKLTRHLDKDVPAGLVVFLVALPLCLGIAVASGAPAMSGLITGIIGGLVVGALSGSPLAVSGPAAGLIAIVIAGITDLGGVAGFAVAVAISGVIQIALGYARAGIIGYYFPSSVIKGMLAAIGLILILKQIPHFLGVDEDYFGDFSFFQANQENTFSEILYALFHIGPGPVVIGVISIVILVVWEQPALKKFKFFQLVPGALIVVVLGALINSYFSAYIPDLYITEEHRVKLPVFTDAASVIGSIEWPNWSILFDPAKAQTLWLTAFTIAIVASLETLLSIEATDKLDPQKRVTPTNRELKAQGIGNVLSGMLGGLPMTAVIVRSSANINANAQTKLSAILHGLFLLVFVLFLGSFLNLIPLTSLAAILLLIGYKLNKPSMYKLFWKRGWEHFLPFIITILAILFSNLLIGIGVGLAVGIFFILRINYKLPYSYNITEDPNTHTVEITLSEQVTFLNKASIVSALDKLPDDSHVILDGSRTQYIGLDVLDEIYDFKESATDRNITVEFKNIPEQ